METIINYICIGVTSVATLYIFFLLGHQVGFDKGIKHHKFHVAHYLPWTDEYKEHQRIVGE